MTQVSLSSRPQSVQLACTLPIREVLLSWAEQVLLPFVPFLLVVSKATIQAEGHLERSIGKACVVQAHVQFCVADQPRDPEAAAVSQTI